LQSADECECRDILTAVGNFGKLVLKVVDARLEVVALSHFKGKKVVVILLGLWRKAYWVRNASVISSKL